MDDVRTLMYGIVLAFVFFIVGWLGLVYVSACGLTLTCQQARPHIDRTPIPTLIPATLPAAGPARRTEFKKCQVAAVDLIGAWVSAGHPKTEPFEFTDVNGATCEGTFPDDVQALFTNSNLWYAGALACSSCHNPTLLTTNAGLDLSTYEGMTKGSQRADDATQGQDLFGTGTWEQSSLYDWLFVRKHIPLARPPELPAEGPVIYAGTRLPASAATSTAMPAATATP
ncbi:MAG TPA: hypothetical protein VGJ22_14295 [Anaerolineales bacterium]|jgi:hypothetical protein